MMLQNENDPDIRNRIKDAARTLFQSKGYENTTVSDLLRAVQVDEWLFFSFFKSTDELLEVVWSES